MKKDSQRIPVNLLILLIGAILSVLSYLFGYLDLSLILGFTTMVLFTIKAYRNFQNKEILDYARQKAGRFAAKLGGLPVRQKIANPVKSDAILLTVQPTHLGSEELPVLFIKLKIWNLSESKVGVYRTVPWEEVSYFQPGRVCKIDYSEGNIEETLSIVSITSEGKEFFLRG
ncbi:MAG: hypothetical protein IT569_01250 [Leptospiraceae bacterium]|nr:hypothetical protein [Leptospiraceae bacterium]